MPSIYVEERDPIVTLIGFAILALIARLGAEPTILMLQGILAFLCSTFLLCHLIVKLVRRVGTDEGLAAVRGPGIHAFASIARAVDAVAYALPAGHSGLVGRPEAANAEASMSVDLGVLLAFGLACRA